MGEKTLQKKDGPIFSAIMCFCGLPKERGDFKFRTHASCIPYSKIPFGTSIDMPLALPINDSALANIDRHKKVELRRETFFLAN